MNLFSFPLGFFFFAINSIFCRISSENSAEACSSWLVWNVRLVHYFKLIKSYLESKPVSEAGISENNAERLSKKMNRSWRRTEASRATVKFWGQSFSRGDYPSIYQQVEEGSVYFIILWTVSQGERTWIVRAYFVDFFAFLGTELPTSLLIAPSLAKLFWFVFHDQ